MGLKLISGWVSIVAAFCMLATALHIETWLFIITALPASLMISGGIRSMMSADYQAPYHIAVGSILALLVSFPAWIAGGAQTGLIFVIGSLASFLAGGWIQIRLQPQFDDVPAPAPDLKYSAKVALDSGILTCMTSLAPSPSRAQWRDAVRESETAHDFYSERGWIESPRDFHTEPPEIDSFELNNLQIKDLKCEQLRFESAFEPYNGLPGRDRWLSYRENYTAHACILRHKQPGPWLICIHGAGMGDPKKDFGAFRIGELHQSTGLNVAHFTLPVHGLRSTGRINGGKFFGVSVLDLVHAEAQAIWDLRRFIKWIRKQGATQIGIYGISLGAYTSALLASIEKDLACVITGVPPCDLIHTREYLASPVDQRLAAAAGVNPERDRDIHGVVSPLRLQPQLPRDRRYMYAASGDQFVPLEQTRALWLHWQEPRISWCTGGHVSSMFQSEPRMLVDEAIAKSFVI